LQKFSNILSSLYELFNLNYIRKELFNLNYIRKDGKNYARISVGKSREQFIEINDKFKVVLLFDEEEVKNIMQAITNRFEKIKLNFSNLLSKEQLKESEQLEKIINKLTVLKLKEELNYDLNILIMN
jgi:hypothetical protein